MNGPIVKYVCRIQDPKKLVYDTIQYFIFFFKQTFYYQQL